MHSSTSKPVLCIRKCEPVKGDEIYVAVGLMMLKGKSAEANTEDVFQ